MSRRLDIGRISTYLRGPARGVIVAPPPPDIGRIPLGEPLTVPPPPFVLTDEQRARVRDEAEAAWAAMDEETRAVNEKAWRMYETEVAK